MEIKPNGACNWDTTGIKTVQHHILKWIVTVCVCNHVITRRNSESRTQKKETYKTWILVREERCWKQPGRSWIFLVSLGEFAMASHSCCTPFEGFCFLFIEIVTIPAHNAMLCKF